MDYVAIVNTDYLDQAWLALTMTAMLLFVGVLMAAIGVIAEGHPEGLFFVIPLIVLVCLAVGGGNADGLSKDRFHEAMAAKGFDNVRYTGDGQFTANHDGEYFTGLLTRRGHDGYDYYITKIPNY